MPEISVKSVGAIRELLAGMPDDKVAIATVTEEEEAIFQVDTSGTAHRVVTSRSKTMVIYLQIDVDTSDIET